MARKFGKKNVIKLDPLAYNIGLIGVSGIGKTTLTKEVCEKLVGEDGYIIANVGKEDGIDAIAGVIYEDVPDWDAFDEFTTDIIENKETDYKDLKVIAWDTIDELFRISEPESIRLYNKDVSEINASGGKKKKRAKTIKQAWGGYGEGEKYTVELVMNRMWELKNVGVAMFLIGHTKKKTLTDVATDTEYDILTTNMPNNYFNAFKTKLHILGVASIDREIVRTKTDKKDFNGKDKIQGKVESETRKITFRDDNFNIDSKSRFSEIIDSIDFDPNEFITAVNNAILVEHNKQKNNKTIEEVRKEQDIEKANINKVNVDKANAKINEEKLENAISQIKNFIKNNRNSLENLDELKAKSKELGLTSPIKVTELSKAEELLKVINF
jgi:GTPase SAR1 family protein